MRGAFAGPYPTRDQAYAAASLSETLLPADDPLARAVEMGLPPDTSYRGANRSLREFGGGTGLKYAIYKDATVIIFNGWECALLDRARGEVYAIYTSRRRG